jgi:hypothetical protein
MLPAVAESGRSGNAVSNSAKYSPISQASAAIVPAKANFLLSVAATEFKYSFLHPYHGPLLAGCSLIVRNTRLAVSASAPLQKLAPNHEETLT